jgi:WD40 repeat protein
VFDDGSKSAPEITPVTRLPWDGQMNRRGFLGASASAAAIMFLIEGSGQAAELERWQATQTEKAQAVGPAKVPSESVAAHYSGVDALALSADGKWLASASSADEMVKLWSVSTGRIAARRTLRDEAINTIAIAPNNKAIVAGLTGTSIRAWSLPACVAMAAIRGITEEETVNAIAFAPDSKTVAAAIDKTIKLWSWPERRLLGRLEGHERDVKSIAITPDGATLVSASSDGSVRMWSLRDRKLTAKLDGQAGDVYDIAMAGDGQLLATASGDKNVRLWSLGDKKITATLKGHTNVVSCVAMIPGSGQLASGSWDNKINIWSVAEAKLLHTLEGHQGSVSALAVTPDAKTLISGDSSGVIIIWDLEERSFRTFLFDRLANDPETKGRTYTVYDRVTGQRITYTLPCGSPIPRGAVCTCNCVKGSYREPYVPDSYSPTRICTCNKICTCIPVYRRD